MADAPSSHTILGDLGDYVIERQLGSGGMADVYEGFQKPPAFRKVAIKVLNDRCAQNPEILARFRDEVQAGAHMTGVHIVTHFAYLERNGRPHIVMELVDGGDLHHWLKKWRPLPLLVALIVLRDIAMALEHAHSKDIVHRDIKPSNILLACAEGCAKLGDFGIARALRGPKLTHDGVIIGTIPYMSPEQTLGLNLDGGPGKLSDIFSFGTVAYELLAGKHPFDGGGRDAHVTMRAIRELEPADLTTINPAVTPEIAGLVRHMHKKEALERCPNFTTIVGSLEEALDALQLKKQVTFFKDYLKDPQAMVERVGRNDLDEYRRSASILQRVWYQRMFDAVRRPSTWALAGAATVALTVALIPDLRDQLITFVAGSHKPKATGSAAPLPKPGSATLQISSTPSGAQVTVNHESRGTTPASVVGLPVGDATIELSMQGFEAARRTFLLRDGMNTFSETLVETKAPPPPPLAARSYFVQPSNFTVALMVDGHLYRYPEKVTLGLGPHTFRMKWPTGETFDLNYIVKADDPTKTLVIDVDGRKIVRSREALTPE